MIATYLVPGISCDHCKRAIESEVGDLPDVAVVEVDVQAKRVRVEGAVSSERVIEAIEAAGYDVDGVTAG